MSCPVPSSPINLLFFKNRQYALYSIPLPRTDDIRDDRYGLDIEVPGASILSSFGFDNSALWHDVLGLAVFSAAFIVLAYGAMHLLLIEKR